MDEKEFELERDAPQLRRALAHAAAILELYTAKSVDDAIKVLGETVPALDPAGVAIAEWAVPAALGTHFVTAAAYAGQPTSALYAAHVASLANDPTISTLAAFGQRITGGLGVGSSDFERGPDLPKPPEPEPEPAAGEALHVDPLIAHLTGGATAKS